MIPITLLWILWSIAIIAKWGNICALIMRALIRRYPVLFAFLTLTLARDLWCSAGLYTGDWNLYGWRVVQTQTIGLAIQTVACLDVYRLYATHFRRVGLFSTLLAGFFGVASIGAIYVAGFVGPQDSPTWAREIQALLWLARLHALAGVAFLGFTRAWFRSLRHEYGRNTSAYATGLMLLMAGHACGYAVAWGMGGAWWLTANLLLVSGSLAGNGYWMMRMRGGTNGTQAHEGFFQDRYERRQG